MKRYFWLSLLICSACVRHQPALSIQLVKSDLSITLTGFDPSVISEIQRDSGAWQNLFPVYRMPADTDMKDFQRRQPGMYRLAGNAVLFTPDTPFIKGQTYFLRYYRSGEGKSTWAIIRQRQKLGSQPFTDMSFRVNGEQ